MKQTTAVYTVKKPCKHSIVFASNADTAPMSSAYINKLVIPTGATECKITVSFPEGGQDEAYNNLK